MTATGFFNSMDISTEFNNNNIVIAYYLLRTTFIVNA